MPACDVVRVASGTGGCKRFWTVRSGGALKLDSEDEAQYFVCHSAQTDRSCLIQHLQSGAFIEQGENRGLKLALSPASATIFSKLRAYSEGSFRRTIIRLLSAPTLQVVRLHLVLELCS